MLILRFSAIFVAILADFILNHCLVIQGIPGACEKHFILPGTNVRRFLRGGTGDKGVDLKTSISWIKSVGQKTKKSGGMTNVFPLCVFTIFMQQDYVILIFKEACSWRVKICYHVHFQAWSVYNEQGNGKQWASWISCQSVVFSEHYLRLTW